MTEKISGKMECQRPAWFLDLQKNIGLAADSDFLEVATAIGDNKWQFAGIMQGVTYDQEKPTDLTHAAIMRRAQQIGTEIAAEILNQKTSETANQGNFLDIICIMNGALPWCWDIEQAITAQFRLRADEPTLRWHCIKTASYQDGTTESGGEVTINGLENLSQSATRLLIVDDICDTGRTLLKVREEVALLTPPGAVIKTCVMLDKPSRRVADVEPDYCGFTIDNQFVVGYGMNYRRDDDRTLPFVGFMTEKEKSIATGE